MILLGALPTFRRPERRGMGGCWVTWLERRVRSAALPSILFHPPTRRRRCPAKPPWQFLREVRDQLPHLQARPRPIGTVRDTPWPTVASTVHHRCPYGSLIGAPVLTPPPHVDQKRRGSTTIHPYPSDRKVPGVVELPARDSPVSRVSLGGGAAHHPVRVRTHAVAWFRLAPSARCGRDIVASWRAMCALAVSG